MEIMVGAFMFMILLALGFFTIILSYENIFQEYHPIEVKFDHVSGLREGDNVFLRGVMIGRVKSLEVEPDGVLVEALLRQPVAIREGYHVTIIPSSVLGGQHLSINEGPIDGEPVAEGTVLHGTPPADIMAEATEVVQSVREALDEGELLENLESTMAQINTITAGLSEGRGTLGRLLTDEEVYEDLVIITANLREVTGALEQGEGTLGALIHDDSLYTNLAEVSSRLADGKGMLGRLLSEDEELYDDVAATAAAVREFTEKISQGRGTLGRMIDDDELYEEARLLLNDMRAAIDDFRETAPVTTFTSIFFGAF